MAPKVAALAQSESKSKFFHRLGLRTDKLHDRRLYATMKMEAAEGRKHLIDSHAPDETINETAMHREILRIYSNASERTKAVYELGHDTEGVGEENWVVRWLLWHAFRYRDQRNNRKSRSGSQISVSGDEEDLSSSADVQSTPEFGLPAEGSSIGASRVENVEVARSPRRFWDPVRGAWQDA
ncbi:hypothetical protein M409DRAFT_62735 [Zasmidium cellare ATCC 36951]|uniref:Uncharacterized protein n=1 Tax=Zasmidium cellare ATCC 36951 TaxID=1080233 RepID=A0A6A6D1S7_ZASCE|nr:uncharacterized protein M409DRAFT_62735 [Zasmidium cellare ATCC 36951]KAF2173135.1 hypothetical protein M409DRAFT_62735 [Zasmidium cellare ATCC 36951]